MPPHALQGGFSTLPGKEESSDRETEEELDPVHSDPKTYNKTQKNHEKENKKHTQRIRRGGAQKCVNNLSKKSINSIKIISTNGAGIKNSKVDSLNAEVQSVQANIVTVQETHSTQKGRIKMDSKLVISEAIRKRKGGGTLVAAHEDFQPKLIEEYSEDFELLVIELSTENKDIRVISGYGPQEIWEEDRRLPYFIALKTEIEKAELAGRSIIIEMDSNSKLGPKYIAQDPHGMSPNGALLSGIIERHSLIVGNGSDKCKRTITRRRQTKHRCEQSVIDHVLFSQDLEKHFESMHIDEERKHVLTRIRKTKNGIKVKESDHNVLVSEFKCKVKHDPDKQVNEVYNLKNSDCQAEF